MNIAFDQHSINHMIVAINREMIPLGNKRHADADTIFMGGSPPTDADQKALAQFGLNKNYKVVFLSFDPKNVNAGPVGIHAVITDGVTEAAVLQNGRLWKKDRRSAAILLFPEFRAALRLNLKGQLIINDMADQYHDHGYDLALAAISDRAGRRPGRTPVVSTIGSMVTVLDMQTMANSFANAE